MKHLMYRNKSHHKKEGLMNNFSEDRLKEINPPQIEGSPPINIQIENLNIHNYNFFNNCLSSPKMTSTKNHFYNQRNKEKKESLYFPSLHRTKDERNTVFSRDKKYKINNEGLNKQNLNKKEIILTKKENKEDNKYNSNNNDMHQIETNKESKIKTIDTNSKAKKLLSDLKKFKVKKYYNLEEHFKPCKNTASIKIQKIPLKMPIISDNKNKKDDINLINYDIQNINSIDQKKSIEEDLDNIKEKIKVDLETIENIETNKNIDIIKQGDDSFFSEVEGLLNDVTQSNPNNKKEKEDNINKIQEIKEEENSDNEEDLIVQNVDNINNIISQLRPGTSYGGIKMRKTKLQNNLKSASHRVNINYKL